MAAGVPPPKKKQRPTMTAGSVGEASSAPGAPENGKPPMSAARKAAMEMLGAGANGSEPSALDEEIDPGFSDYIEEQREHMKATRRAGDVPKPNEPVTMPEPFEKVSICAKGPCKWYFELVAPVSARIYDTKAAGGQRYAMATIRRCLMGAVKLDTDEPIKVSMMKHVGTEAPYGAQRCSHWTPMNDAEVAARDERILQYKDREAEHARLADIRQQAVEARPVAAPAPDPSVEDPGAEIPDAPVESVDPESPAGLLRELANPEGA